MKLYLRISVELAGFKKKVGERRGWGIRKGGPYLLRQLENHF
jgi:hypothetical protein